MAQRKCELTSQDMGAYGIDRKTNIAEPMAKIAGMDGDFKVRIGMLNPEHLEKYFDPLVEQLKNTKGSTALPFPNTIRQQQGSCRMTKELQCGGI